MKKISKTLSSIGAGLCVAGLFAATSVQANLVLNGTFGTVSTPSLTADWNTGGEYGAVTATTYGSPSVSVAELNGSIAYTYYSGLYYADLSQALSGLQASTTYTVSFEAAASGSVQLYVSLGDTWLTGWGPNPNEYSTTTLTSYSVQVTTSSATIPNAIDFHLQSASAQGNAYITDVSVTPVPEPTTMVAGALLLLPFGASTLRILRRKQTA